MEDSEDYIAVIGIGCNFPGGKIKLNYCFLFHHISDTMNKVVVPVCLGEGLDHFWKVLSNGKNCVSDIPAERFNSTFWYDPDDGKPGKTQTRKAAFIQG